MSNTAAKCADLVIGHSALGIHWSLDIGHWSFPKGETVSPLDRIERLGFRVGAIALAAFVATGLLDLPTFSRAYLVAYWYWLGFSLGAMVLLMVQHLTGGAWGLVIRRILEAASRTLPLMAVLFLPVLLAVQFLYYPWAGWTEEQLAANEVLHKKSLYLNVPFFAVRALVYFGAWLGLMYLLNRWSQGQDQAAGPGDRGDRELSRRLGRISALGLVGYGATITFASIDWVMSLEPLWYSTIFGALLGTGQILTALSFAILTLVLVVASRGPAASTQGAEARPESSLRDSGVRALEQLASPRTLQDLGSLLLAFVMLWAYMQFSQYLIIWSGNLPEETPWYLSRLQGAWALVGLLLILFHFALPFLLLLSRDIKRHARRLANVAILVLVMRFVDVVWLIAPAGAESHGNLGHAPDPAWVPVLALVAAVGIGGLWLALFAHELQKRPLLPRAELQPGEAVHHD